MDSVELVQLSIYGFLGVSFLLMYIFRENKMDRVPSTAKYDYDGASSNPKLNKQIERNAYFHTLAPSYKGAMYGLHNDRRKKAKL